MKKLILIIAAIIAIQACSTMQVKQVNYSEINNPAFLACMKTRIDYWYQRGYVPTDKGYENVEAFCYITLKAAGVIK